MPRHAASRGATPPMKRMVSSSADISAKPSKSSCVGGRRMRRSVVRVGPMVMRYHVQVGARASGPLGANLQGMAMRARRRALQPAKTLAHARIDTLARIYEAFHGVDRVIEHGAFFW